MSLLIEVCSLPPEKGRRKRSLVNHALEVMAFQVTSLSSLHRTAVCGTRYQLKNGLFRLPIAVLKVHGENFVCEKLAESHLDLLYGLLVREKTKTHTLTAKTFKRLRSLLPQPLHPVANVIAVVAGSLTTREAKNIGISNVRSSFVSIQNRIQQLVDLQRQVDNTVDNALYTVEGQESMPDMGDQIKNLYGPMEREAALAVLKLIRKKSLNLSIHPNEAVNAKPTEFQHFLVKVVTSLLQMRLSRRNRKLAEKLQTFVCGKRYCDSESDSEDDASDPALAGANQKTADEYPDTDAKIQLMVGAYRDAIVSYGLRNKKKFWGMVRNQKNKRPGTNPRVLKKYPNIGTLIEAFVIANNIGAHPWRRLDTLTVGANDDGTVTKRRRVTYESIREYLAKQHNIFVSKSTVHYCCAMRRARRIMHRRFYEVASVTFRKSLKGHNTKYTPDAMWSNALYKMKDFVELKGRKDVIVLNRDDAAIFKCDTVESHCNNPILVKPDSLHRRSRTDFKEAGMCPTEIQVTSYLFPKTQAHRQHTIGAVKPRAIFEKSATQHFDDYEIVRKMDEVKNLFNNYNQYEIMVHRRDGSSDEGPSFSEVQFWLAYEHLRYGQLLTICTTRWPGGSYLNPVERMNGSLKRAENLLFLPSTIMGSNKGWQSDLAKRGFMKDNLHAAATVFANYVNGARHGSSKIQLMMGKEHGFSDLRHLLKTFLKPGCQAKKNKMKAKYPSQWRLFERVRKIQETHEVKTSIGKYFYGLSPCYEESCQHPICADSTRHDSARQQSWGDGLPMLSKPFYPVRDPDRPWGGPCETCKGVCPGHYMEPERAFRFIASDPELQETSCPSFILKTEVLNAAKNGRTAFTIEETRRLAQKCRLTIEEVTWVANHEFGKKNVIKGTVG